MPGAPSVLARVDTAMRPHHAAIDAPWLELASGVVAPKEYLHHLVRVYGFRAPLESALALTPRVALVIDLRERARTSWIVQDLLLLGLRPAKIARLPQCSSIVPFRDDVEALGWMCLAEYIAGRHDAVRANIAFELPDAPTAYLSAPRADPRALADALEHIATSDAVVERVISAALAAIACHVAWFSSDVRLSSPNLATAR
ncbi:MAG: hypothetical protein ACM31C_33100 [Acidobacteriota bacterium]